MVARIYTAGNVNRQGGWVNKSSSPFQKFLKFYNTTPYPYICNNFFLGSGRQ